MLTTSKPYADQLGTREEDSSPRDGLVEEEQASTSRTFDPPYRLVSPGGEAAVHAEPPYAEHLRAKEREVSDSEWSDALNSEEARSQVNQQVDSVKTVMVPLVMLLAGSVFFLFGLVLFLFAQNGTLTLRWNASYALVYLLSGAPLLYYGWLALSKVDDQLR